MYSAVSLPVSLVPLFWHRRLAAAA
jgi:hypothetical protein